MPKKTKSGSKNSSGAFLIQSKGKKSSTPSPGQKRKHNVRTNYAYAVSSTRKSQSDSFSVHDDETRKRRNIHRFGKSSSRDSSRFLETLVNEEEFCKNEEEVLSHHRQEEANIPEDELFSCFCYHIRKGNPRLASFWASVIERRGLVSQLWKCMCIFAFRDIGWGYPEASCYVYDYYLLWKREMKRYYKELKMAMRECLHTKAYSEEICDDDGDRQEHVITWWNSLSPKQQHEELSAVQVPVDKLPQYNGDGGGPCSCTMDHYHNHNIEDVNGTPYESSSDSSAPLSAEHIEMTSNGWFLKHLSSARHFIISVVHYLSVIPKTSLSLKISFYRSMKSIGGLMDEDWTCAKLSHPYLEHELYTRVRKELPQALSQSCLCLCSSIVFRDEERATRITELFISWKREDVFWDCLSVICAASHNEYSWIHPYLNKYYETWKFSNNWNTYFLEGCSTALYSAVLLFVRGLPKRNVNAKIISPENVKYSQDYVSMYHGTHMPSIDDTRFCFVDDDDDVDNVDEDDEEEDEEFPLFDALVNGFCGVPITDTTNPYGSKGECDYRNLNRYHGQAKSRSGSFLSFSSSSVDTMLIGRRERFGQSHSPTSQRDNKSNRIAIETAAVNWTTHQGQELCMTYKQALSNSESGSNKAIVANRYNGVVDEMLKKQLQRAMNIRRQRDMLKKSNSVGTTNPPDRSVFHTANDIVNGVDPLISSEKMRVILFEDLISSDITAKDMHEIVDEGIALYRKICQLIESLEVINWYDPAIPMVYRSLGNMVMKLESTFPQLGRIILDDDDVAEDRTTMGVNNEAQRSDVGYLGDVNDERFKSEEQEEGDAMYLKPHTSADENMEELEDRTNPKNVYEEVYKHSVSDFALMPVDKWSHMRQTHVMFFDSNEWLHALEQYYTTYRQTNAFPEDEYRYDDTYLDKGGEPYHDTSDVPYDLPELDEFSECSSSEVSTASELAHCIEDLIL